MNLLRAGAVSARLARGIIRRTVTGTARNCELTLKDGQPALLFDLDGDQLSALATAFESYLRGRAVQVVEHADGALALRTLADVSGELDRLAAAGLAGSLRLSERELRWAAEAVALYLAVRDVDAYQPPEMRARIALLWPLSELLRELTVAMRRTLREPARATSLPAS
jgi:hypothetical protein